LLLKEDYGNGYSHAEKLHRYIESVLKDSNVSKSNLSAIAVSKGPGSYTGLRIGVSAAKGLCYALDIPLISISTLESLAYQVKTDSGLIVPMLDARRMEVYSAIFSESYNPVRVIEAQVLDENSFKNELQNQKVTFIGNGVEKTKLLLNSKNAVFIEGKLPSADQMSGLAFAKFKNKTFEDVAYFEPYYLKDFVALKPKPKV
jgi:tRNA threonylcarbamoyladenosine biosynthesis protein TsaB